MEANLEELWKPNLSRLTGRDGEDRNGESLREEFRELYTQPN